MCECGCSLNNKCFWMPAANGAVYLVTLVRACVSCDGPDAVTIELFDSKKLLKGYCFEMPEQFRFEKWPESKGLVIATGRTKSEFVKAVKPSLVGLNSADFADKPGDPLDINAAEVILEDLYEETTFGPTWVRPRPPSPGMASAAAIAANDDGGSNG